jgi:hypothetical protein
MRTPKRDLSMDNPINKSVTSPKPKLLDQVRAVIRMKHYSPRTEESYIYWIRKYIFFHQKRHSANKIIELKVNYEEAHLQKLIKSAGGRWNREKKLWELPYKDVVALGLENRIVLLTGKKCKNA